MGEELPHVPHSAPHPAVKLLVSLLPEQQAELQHGRRWLRQLWALVSRAIVVKARCSLLTAPCLPAPPLRLCVYSPVLCALATLTSSQLPLTPTAAGGCEKRGAPRHAAPHAGAAAG